MILKVVHSRKGNTMETRKGPVVGGLGEGRKRQTGGQRDFYGSKTVPYIQ